MRPRRQTGCRGRDLGEHHVAGMALDQSDDVAVPSRQQIAFPVAGTARSRPRQDARGSTPAGSAARVALGWHAVSGGSAGTQMLAELFEHAAGLDEQTAIDRLVRHPIRLVSGWVRSASRRCAATVASEMRGHDSPQVWVPRELTRLRTPSRRQACRSEAAARYGPEPPLRAISRLTVDGARPRLQAIRRNECPCASPREISSRSASVSASLERRRGGGRMPPVGQIREDRRRGLAEDPADRLKPFALAPSVPDIGTLRRRKKRRFRVVALHSTRKGKGGGRAFLTTEVTGNLRTPRLWRILSMKLSEPDALLSLSIYG